MTSFLNGYLNLNRDFGDLSPILPTSHGPATKRSRISDDGAYQGTPISEDVIRGLENSLRLDPQTEKVLAISQFLFRKIEPSNTYTGHTLDILMSGDGKLRVLERDPFENIYGGRLTTLFKCKGRSIKEDRPPKEKFYVVKELVRDHIDIADTQRKIESGIRTLKEIEEVLGYHHPALMKPLHVFPAAPPAYPSYIAHFFSEGDLTAFTNRGNLKAAESADPDKAKGELTFKILNLFAPFFDLFEKIEHVGVVASDFKCANIFVKENEKRLKGKWGDMDGVYRLPQASPETVRATLKKVIEKLGFPIYTPSYTYVNFPPDGIGLISSLEKLAHLAEDPFSSDLEIYHLYITIGPGFIKVLQFQLAIAILDTFLSDSDADLFDYYDLDETDTEGDEKETSTSSYVTRLYPGDIQDELQNFGYAKILGEEKFDKFLSLLLQMLSIDPSLRPTPADANRRFQEILA